MDNPEDVEITPTRLQELIRWHGTDERNLPAAHTLRNLSRDTVAALGKLERCRESLEELRAAMGRAFWASHLREMRTILLDALGPPPAEAPSAQSVNGRAVEPGQEVGPEVNGVSSPGGRHPPPPPLRPS